MSIKKNTNETTALKKWPILLKIVGKMGIEKHKQNHRAQKMADFMGKCRKNEHQKNTNEATALKKWPIFWKIVGKIAFFGPKDGRDSTQIRADLWSGWGQVGVQVGVACVVRVCGPCVVRVCGQIEQ